MSVNEVRLYIPGLPENINVETLQRTSEALADFLSAADIPQWTLTDLSLGSLNVAAVPSRVSASVADTEIADLKEGLLRSVERMPLPLNWGGRVLRAIIAMNQTSRDVEAEGPARLSINGEVFSISDQVAQYLKEQLAVETHSFSSVSGVIDRFTDRKGRREFGLIDDNSKLAVTVLFSAKDEAKVRASIGQTVTVWGLLSCGRAGEKKRLKMEGMTVETVPSGSVTVDDLVGLLPDDWTGGMSSVDWIRGQRNG